MKKKIFSIITLLIMCVLWVNAQGVPGSITSFDAHLGLELTYTCDGNEATIIKVAPYPAETALTNVTIPEVYDDYTIVEISSWRQDNISQPAFPNGVVTVKLPSTIRTIAELSFQNCSTLKTVEFEKNEVKDVVMEYMKNCSLTTIGNNAFENCTSLATFGVKK